MQKVQTVCDALPELVCYAYPQALRWLLPLRFMLIDSVARCRGSVFAFAKESRTRGATIKAYIMTSIPSPAANIPIRRRKKKKQDCTHAMTLRPSSHRQTTALRRPERIPSTSSYSTNTILGIMCRQELMHVLNGVDFPRAHNLNFLPQSTGIRCNSFRRCAFIR